MIDLINAQSRLPQQLSRVLTQRRWGLAPTNDWHTIGMDRRQDLVDFSKFDMFNLSY